MAKKLKMSPRSASNKARLFRLKGIDLKLFRAPGAFPSGKKAELNRIARKYLTVPDRTFIDPKEFVRVWQEAGSIGDVIKHFGESKVRLQQRAAHYRQRYKIPLKSFRSPLMKDKIQ